MGFDIPLKDDNEISHVSLGANAKYLYVEGNEDVDSNAVSLNGVVKFWLPMLAINLLYIYLASFSIPRENILPLKKVN